MLILLSRVLGKEDFGTYALAQVCFGFATFFADAGLSNTLYYADRANKEVNTTIFWIGLIFSVLLSLLLLMLSGPMAVFYQNPWLKEAIMLTALALFFSGLGMLPRVLLRREFQFAQLAKIDLAALSVQACTTLYLAYSGTGVFALVWGNIVFYGLASGANWIIVGKNNWPSLSFSRAVMLENRSFGLFQIGERSLNYIAERADVLIIGKMLGPGPLGIYDVMKQLLSRPEALINPAVCQVALSQMASVRENAQAVKRIYLDKLFLILKLNLPVYGLLFIMAEPLLLLLLGPQWAVHKDVFRWLALFYIIHSSFNPIGALQMAKGRADLGFYFNLLLFFLMPCAVFTGSFGGLTGVASSLFGLFLVLIPLYYKYYLSPLLK